MRTFTTMASQKPKEEEKKKKKKKKSSSSGKEAKPLKTPDKKTGPLKKQSKPKPKSDNKTNRSRNGTVDDSRDPIDLSSSTESEESEPEREEERSMKTKNQCNKSPKPKKRKQKVGEDDDDDDDDDEQKEEAKLCRFPMNRIKRIIKSGDCNKGITQDAIFLVNKATEKFLERFCEDAYHFTVKDRKKSLGYKHLSSVVSKQKRYEFISDFVPEKVKAEDVLKEMKLSESKLG